VSGEGPEADLVVLEDDESGRVGAYITTLLRLPPDPPWILVGGLAVNARVGRTHRATNDIDTVSPDQDRLVEILVAFPDAEAISAAKTQFHDPEVEVDVMDSTDSKELPPGERDRAFALARRFAMRSASPVTIGSVDTAGRRLSWSATPWMWADSWTSTCLAYYENPRADQPRRGAGAGPMCRQGGGAFPDPRGPC